MRILVVCSANRCRSPMAAALLGARLDERGTHAMVSSAGFGPPGQPVATDATAVMAEIGIDVAGYRSARLSADSCAQADLIVTMTRQHVMEVVLADPRSWPRTFPLVSLVRRGHEIGPRGTGEHVTAWVRRAHGGRAPAGLLRLPPDDDIADPIGRPLADFRRTRQELDHVTADLAALLYDRPADC